MAVNTDIRNMRDGSITINDGSDPVLSAELILESGDLSWTETENTTEVLDRGRISGGSIRPGNDEPVTLSFSVKDTYFIGHTGASGDPHGLYEMVNNLENTYTSTYGGCKYTLEYVFAVSDCGNSQTEYVTFAYVYKTSLEFSEGDEFNSITFNGRDWETKPTITKVAEVTSGTGVVSSTI